MKLTFTNLLYKVTDIIFNLYANRPLAKANLDETRLINELKNNLDEIILIADKKKDTDQEWMRNVQELVRQLHFSDARKFLQWDVIRRTMFVGNIPYLGKELKFLKDNGWKELWMNRLNEVSIGRPDPFLFYPKSSGNMIHHAYHVSQFVKHTSIPISEIEMIIEFGGGYGSMCRLLYQIGFKGQYIIYDLPHFSALQIYFLKSIGYKVLKNEYNIQKPISCISEFKLLKETLDGNFKNINLFIATWSLSETPLPFREEFIKLVNHFDLFLIGYQNYYGKTNNVAYFNEWMKRMKHVLWNNYEINHLPGNYYLIGKKRLIK